MQNKYEFVQYSDQDQQILDNTNFTIKEVQKINSIKTKLKNKSYSPAIEELCKFHKNSYSTSDLAEIYKVSTRQIQRIFKELGINRNQSEAQQIAQSKIDYDSMKKIYNKTMLERLTDTELSASSLDQNIRYQIYSLLKSALPNCEIIVGISSMEISNFEINVPIIIINKNSLYKYIIEITDMSPKTDSDLKRLKNKNSETHYMGYTSFKINTKAYCDSKENPKIKYENEIKSKLMRIVNAIISEVSENNSSVRLE